MLEKVIIAIKMLKNNKTAGIDQVPAELIKYAGEETYTQIHEVITDME